MLGEIESRESGVGNLYRFQVSGFRFQGAKFQEVTHCAPPSPLSIPKSVRDGIGFADAALPLFPAYPDAGPQCFRGAVGRSPVSREVGVDPITPYNMNRIDEQ